MDKFIEYALLHSRQNTIASFFLMGPAGNIFMVLEGIILLVCFIGGEIT
jgi:hypothetical protein